jgi:uncharacterized membrane protein YoaK (UPF0700 family)
MSGIISAMADNFAVGSIPLFLSGLLAVAAFLSGALLTTLLVRWARARELESEYALPLLLEAGLLVVFGTKGRVFAGGHVLDTVVLLCFTMGLQNAIITKISDAVIRTTHLTGMVTDIGISLGRLISTLSMSKTEVVSTSEMTKLRLLSSLVGLFFTGGLVGALGFKHVGFFFTLPLAFMLLLLSVMPVVDDVQRYRNPAT